MKSVLGFVVYILGLIIPAPLKRWLFGKSAKIFDKDGTVRHIFPDKKWNDWNNRYQQGAEYNWRNHTGTKSQEKPRP